MAGSISTPHDLVIVSGGQTGADRAALDFAIRHHLPHDGWCPRGRRAEDGPLPRQYLLRETPLSNYSQRTEWNVRDSDATVALTITPQLRGGTALTIAMARKWHRPWLHLAQQAFPGPPPDDAADAALLLRQFLARYQVRRLNVAGPRQSQQPAIAPFVDAVLTSACIDAASARK